MQNYVFVMLLKHEVKIFNLISRTNETRYIKQRETGEFKCRLDCLQVFVTINKDGIKRNADAND